MIDQIIQPPAEYVAHFRKVDGGTYSLPIVALALTTSGEVTFLAAKQEGRIFDVHDAESFVGIQRVGTVWNGA